ncbi:glycosyltransferase [Candidatus Woesearchaeota archaeon]|nr:glycosyltransferase [Candidatus Woesearchaeota archaeon]
MLTERRKEGNIVPAVSIVIPTYNEEKYLHMLLESIKRQRFKDIEVIVSDAPSKDKTQNIAKKFGCKIVKPSSLPSVARNLGAKAAKAKYLLFVDADVILPEGFLSRIISNFKNKNYVCASVSYKPLSSRLVDKAAFLLINLFSWLFQRVSPHGAGWCIIIRKNVFEKIGGFNTAYRICEDHDLIKRAAKIGRFGFMLNNFVWVSTRRFDKEGRLKYFAKVVAIIVLYNIFGVEKAQKLFGYEFGKF